VKPAAARSCSRRIAVMTTAATATSDRLRDLIARHAQGVHVHVQPCPELASAIECGVLGGPALREILQPYCAEILAADVDTVVLGCTHYSFVEESIRDLLGSEVRLIDTTAAVAERTASNWEQVPTVLDAAPNVRVLSTGAVDTMQRLLARCAGLDHVNVESHAL
jgi:glutamate racemase